MSKLIQLQVYTRKRTEIPPMQERVGRSVAGEAYRGCQGSTIYGYTDRTSFAGSRGEYARDLSPSQLPENQSPATLESTTVVVLQYHRSYSK